MKQRGDWLKSRRQELKFSREFVAEKLGVTPSAIQHLENKKDAMPSLELGMNLAALYGRSVEWVLGGDRFEGANIAPVIGTTDDGPESNWIDHGYDENSSYSFVKVPNGKKIYGLRVSRNSMNGHYQEGDVILIDPDTELVNGEEVIIKTTDDESMILVLLRIDNEEVHLSSANYEKVIRKRSEIALMHPVIGCVKSFLIQHE